MKCTSVLRLTFMMMLLALSGILAQVPARIQRPPRPTGKLSLQTPAPVLNWAPGKMLKFGSASGAAGEILKDGSVLLSGTNPAVDTYTVALETDLAEVLAVRIEAMVHPSLGGTGPGRTPHGNFVISEVTAFISQEETRRAAVKFARAEADFEQEGFPAANAIDGNRATGWAINGPANSKWNVNRNLTLTLATPVKSRGASHWTITIDQRFGSLHTLGRFRILFGTTQAIAPLIPTFELIPLNSGLVAQQFTFSTGDWDFETGRQGWTVGAESGDSRAFGAQPTYGDNVHAGRLRQANTKAMGFDPAINTRIGGNYWDTPVYTGYQGEWWVGSSENRPNKNSPAGGRGSEDHRGHLFSPDFRLDKPAASCLLSGGTDLNNLRVELQVRWNDAADRDRLVSQLAPSALPNVDGQYVVVSRVTGPGSEVMTRSSLGVPAFARGRMARYKIIDKSLAGHINVDDFRVGDSVPASPAPVWGFVDTHTHPMIHMAFGGGWSGSPGQRNSLIWGSPGGKLEASLVAVDDLPDCDGFTHGNALGLGNAVIDHVLRLIGNFSGPLLRHGPGGFLSGLNTWPAPNGVAGLLHQQMHVQWLRRAFDGGQRILVAAAINNQLLERAIKNGFDATGNKRTTPSADGDFHTCVQQTLAMKDLVAKNSTWMEVVTSPAQARNAIRNNKLAIVLAVETDWLNGMDQVRTLYNLGVRHITPVHLMDNLFGSSAVYDLKFNTLNAWYNGQIFDVTDGQPVGVSLLPDKIIPIVNFLFNIPTAPGFASGGDLLARGYTINASWPPGPNKYQGYINKHGLNNYTRALGGAAKPDPIASYKEMMRMGMLIDIAHMSHKSVEEMLALADQQAAGADKGYPLSSSHGGIREHEDHKNERSLNEAQSRRMLALGGTLALGMGPAKVNTAPGTTVPNDSHGTVKSFAQLIQHANNLSASQNGRGGITLGSDFNGLNGMMGPRFGPKAPAGASQLNGVRYLNFASPGVPVNPATPLMRPSTMISGKGTRTFDYNVEGLAHYGLMPDMFQDARNAGLRADQLGPIFRGAEDFIRMWEKCERMKSSIVAANTAPAPANPTNPTAPPVANPVPASAASTARMTGFDPKRHGFRFTNDFKNSVFGPPIKVVTGGLCGGMSFTALDYFLANRQIPQQTYRPAHSTALQSYIYKRQETSLLQTLDKWVNYEFNPFGSRTLEIFNWGLRERLTELRSFIDRGIPVPLGLKGTGTLSALQGGDHQVLAVGYDLGRYKGDVGDHKEDLKIFLCEPNYPGELITMVADPAKLEFYYKEHPNVRWRSYFVDGAYTRMTPPTVANPVDPDANKDGLLHALMLSFTSGNLELPGGVFQVNLRIIFNDGSTQDYSNISQGGRWLPQYQETVEVVLKTPRKLEDIRALMLTTTNSPQAPWDMKSIYIRAIGGGYAKGGFKDPGSYRFAGLPLFIMRE